TDEAIDALWEYSGYGIPRLINKVCKLCLKAGETNRFEQISGEVVGQIGERFQRLSVPAPARKSAGDRTEEPLHDDEEPLQTAEDLTTGVEVSTGVALAIRMDLATPEQSAPAPKPFAVEGEKTPQATELPTAEPEEMDDKRKVLVFGNRTQPAERGEEPEAVRADGVLPEGVSPDGARVEEE